MDIDEHHAGGGHHYSGRNRVPNIQEFVQRLDRQKQQRDAAIDEETKQRAAQGQNGDAKDHEPEKRKKSRYRTVRDPVTGKDVQIEDVHTDFKDVVDNPVVSTAGPHVPWPPRTQN